MNGVKFLAAHRKAIMAFAVPLVGGMCYLISTDQFDLKHVCGVLAVALGSGGATHVIPNAGVAPVQDVVNAVTAAVPTEVAPTVAAAVTNTSTGVLKDAVGLVDGIVGGLGGILGGKG